MPHCKWGFFIDCGGFKHPTKKGFNVLAENTEDIANGVRFAVLNSQDKEIVVEYLKKVIDNVKISLVLEKCSNPVLSKLKVNIESRYSL